MPEHGEACELLADLLARLARLPAEDLPEVLSEILATLPED